MREAFRMHAMAMIGIVVICVVVLGGIRAAILLFPDFFRYLKMRSL